MSCSICSISSVSLSVNVCLLWDVVFISFDVRMFLKCFVILGLGVHLDFWSSLLVHMWVLDLCILLPGISGQFEFAAGRISEADMITSTLWKPAWLVDISVQSSGTRDDHITTIGTAAPCLCGSVTCTHCPYRSRGLYCWLLCKIWGRLF